MKKSDFKKKLAEEIHAGLKGFINYILAKADHLPDGSIKIKKAQVERWKRMADSTHYKLRPNEKVWANAVVDRILYVMDNLKKNILKVKPDPRVDEVKALFIEYTKNIKGFEPKINHKIESGMIKEMLKKYSVEELGDLFDWFMNSSRYSTFSCSIKTILSTGVINSWLQERG